MNLALDRIHTQVTHTCATSLFVGFAMLLPVQNSAAQTEIDICGQASLPTVAASVPTAGEYRALVVFVKFDGDTSTSRDWPDTLTAPPDFADSLIASSPDPASYTGDVFPEHTITRYFYDQSNALDPFILYGDIYEDVIVTDSTEYAYYNQDASGNQQVGGFGFLTLEVLSKIDPAVDFSDYDANQDGEIDYLFIVIRGNPEADKWGDNLVTYGGVSHLESRSGTISNTNWGGPGPPNVTLDSKSLNWANGAFIFNQRPQNIIPVRYHARLWAHEIGHDLWENYFVHLPNIATNDVPIGPVGPSAPPTSRLGYTLTETRQRSDRANRVCRRFT